MDIIIVVVVVVVVVGIVVVGVGVVAEAAVHLIIVVVGWRKNVKEKGSTKFYRIFQRTSLIPVIGMEKKNIS